MCTPSFRLDSFSPLCSLLGCCPSSLLFSGPPLSMVLLGGRDLPLQFRARGSLLARGVHAWDAPAPGELYPALGRGDEERVKKMNF